jgi:energy-coupling factor transporter ATP-binding protein EcfA2
VVLGRRDSQIIGVPWHVFDAWFRDTWQPGEHIACIGPTGTGKSTFVVRLLGMRKHVLAIDPKGEDSTLTASGFQRIRSWPPPEQVRKDIADGKGARLVVGGGVRTPEEWTQLTRTVGDVLDAVFSEGGWTCFTDELQIAAQMMGHSLRVQRNLVALRDKKSSMVTAYQAPSWVPTASTRQARWMCVWSTRDEDVIKNVAAKAGRPKAEIQGLLHELPDYHVAIIPQSPRDPIVITHPPKLGDAPGDGSPVDLRKDTTVSSS